MPVLRQSVGAAVVLLSLAEVRQYDCRTNGQPDSYLLVAPWRLRFRISIVPERIVDGIPELDTDWISR